jgi:ABC-type multidrug transport system ATPase subunit
LIPINQVDQLDVQLEPDNESLSREEYYNNNTSEPIQFAMNLNLENDSEFVKKLKISLKDTEVVRRNALLENKVKMINEQSKTLGVYYTIKALDYPDERQDYVMKSSLFYDLPENSNQNTNLPGKGKTNLSELLAISFDYAIFSKFLKDNFIVFPEFRNKPGQNTISVTTSPSGSELTSALDNLKNGSWNKQQKFKEIERTFKELFEFDFSVSKEMGLKLSFINKDNNLEISSEGVGGGVIQMLNILTHVIGEKNKVFIIDEPELNLHPHKKRILLNVLKNASLENQVILTTHSSEFIDMEEIDKVNIIKLINGRSIITRFGDETKNSPYMQKVLLKLKKTEQKEFFFARKVLLVEGDTEFGALPKFAENLGFNLDIRSISIIPIGSNYFVGLIKILQEFKIPFLVLCDLDVLMNIKSTVTYGTKKIKTSSIFNQLNELNLLTKDDKEKLDHLEKNIVKYIPSNKANSPTVRFLQSLIARDISKDLVEQAKKVLSQEEIEVYDPHIKDKILEIFESIKSKFTTNIKILNSDFEGLFKDHKDLLKNSRVLYGSNKVLQGYYLAQNVPKEKIPQEIVDLIDMLKTTESIL